MWIQHTHQPWFEMQHNFLISLESGDLARGRRVALPGSHFYPLSPSAELSALSVFAAAPPGRDALEKCITVAYMGNKSFALRKLMWRCEHSSGEPFTCGCNVGKGTPRSVPAHSCMCLSRGQALMPNPFALLVTGGCDFIEHFCFNVAAWKYFSSFSRLTGWLKLVQISWCQLLLVKGRGLQWEL